MRSDIEPGPVEHRLNVGSFDGQAGVGSHRGAIEHKHAQSDAPEDALPGSAAAAHGADISSASIPAVSFVMTATMPARGDQRNQRNPIDFSSSSGFADS